MKNLMMALAFVCWPAFAAPFLTTDPSPDVPTPTGCTCSIDGASKTGIIVSKACKVDLATLSVGTHSATCQFTSTDPIWGNGSSVPSAPFSFSRPSAPTPPTGLGLSAS
jgi:hypothetical protein